MEEYDLVIQNGRLVTAEESMEADLAIQGEKIAAIGHELSGRDTYDAAGRLVTPGAIDLHVHLETPVGDGVVTCDDFFTGTRAASFGGTTTIVDFVQAAAKQSLPAALAERRAAADARVVVDYALHMTVQPADIPKLGQIPAVAAAGCTSFKLYMAYGFRLDDAEMLQTLEAIRDVGGMPVVHAENWDVIGLLIRRNLAAGHTAPRWHPRSRPEIMEAEAAGRLIDLAQLAGVPVHIFHVSCQPVVDRITAAKAAGMPVTGETCPHYLFLTDEAYEAEGLQGLLPVCSPPLRPEKERLALWQALASGALDIVTTDHGAYTLADKQKGEGDFSRTPGGVPGIEMRFAALYDGVKRGLYSENRWVDMCCTGPARIAGLKGKGRLTPGSDADIVIFDPGRSMRLSTDSLHENVAWTLYDGLEMQGWPQAVMSRGEWLVRDGMFTAEPGRGRYIHRE